VRKARSIAGAAGTTTNMVCLGGFPKSVRFIRDVLLSIYDLATTGGVVIDVVAMSRPCGSDADIDGGSKLCDTMSIPGNLDVTQVIRIPVFARPRFPYIGVRIVATNASGPWFCSVAVEAVERSDDDD
jgi:hypothetical protein